MGKVHTRAESLDANARVHFFSRETLMKKYHTLRNQRKSRMKIFLGDLQWKIRGLLPMESTARHYPQFLRSSLSYSEVPRCFRWN